MAIECGDIEPEHQHEPPTSRRVRITLGPGELQKLFGPVVVATLSGVAALIQGQAEGQLPREALNRAIDVSSRNLFAMYEQNYDPGTNSISLEATVSGPD